VVTADTTDDNSMGKYVTVRYDDTSNNCTWYVYYLHLESVGVRGRTDGFRRNEARNDGHEGTSTGVHLHIDFNKVFTVRPSPQQSEGGCSLTASPVLPCGKTTGRA
jgi:hypothetical protein